VKVGSGVDVRASGSVIIGAMIRALRPCLALVLLAAGCGPKNDPGESATEASSEGSGDDASGGGGGSVTAVTTLAPTTSGGSGPGTSATTTATTATTVTTTTGTSDFTTGVPEPTTSPTTDPTTITTTGTSTTTGAPCNDVPEQPLDASCFEPSGCGCASGRCFVVPALGGLCGECLSDADCPDGGCTVPNPLAGVGSRCNDGTPADGCMSDEACKTDIAPHCGLVLEVPGIISVATCGECETNADCGPAEPICTPVYDLPDFTGVLVCKAVGSVANDQGCALAPGGAQACASGTCAVSDVMGLFELGICSECDANADCQPGQICTPAIVDLDAGVLIGSVCQ
jgi:hypothetical protein